MNFAFSRTSHFAGSNSSTCDVFSFLIYAFSMQIGSFPFDWSSVNIPLSLVFRMYRFLMTFRAHLVIANIHGGILPLVAGSLPRKLK